MYLLENLYNDHLNMYKDIGIYEKKKHSYEIEVLRN